MSDLDDDLLALAGDGVSDSEFEPKDFKRSMSPVSSSKRRKTHVGDFDDEEEDEDEDEDEDEVELINPYPLEGKYRDAEDRENLLSMDEIQREQTLFDRSQEMESYNEKKYLQQRMKQQRASAEGAKSTTTRSSARSKLVKETAKGSKLDKLSELRKQREQKSRREQKRKDYDDYEDDEEEDDDDDDGDDDRIVDDDEEDDYGYGDYDDKVSWGSGASSKVRSRRSNERATFESIGQVKVGRTMLHRFCYYSEFNESIIDCYARINVGTDKRTRKPMYRMVQIVDVKNIPLKAYKFPTTMVDIYLTVAQNSKQKKDFPMNIFSDSPITLDEFERYKAELSKNDEELPYLDDIREKIDVLHHLSNKEISDKDVNDMIKRKQQLKNSSGTTKNLESFDAVYQKSKVKDELVVAEQEGNIAKINKLEGKLLDLENMIANTTRQLADNAKSAMYKVNERNRKLNQTNIRIAELKSSQMKKLAEASNDGGDPFSRFKTNTRIFYEDLVNEENQKALVDAKLNYEKELAEKTEKEVKIASSSYRSLGVMDELIRKVDLDIELQI